MVIAMDSLDYNDLPEEGSIAALTLAELTAGPLAASTPSEAAVRTERLQWAEGKFEAIPFDAAAARPYGRIYAAVIESKQKPRGGRAVDFLIAATALSRGLPLSTRNPADFASIATIVTIVKV